MSLVGRLVGLANALESMWTFYVLFSGFSTGLSTVYQPTPWWVLPTIGLWFILAVTLLGAAYGCLVRLHWAFPIGMVASLGVLLSFTAMYEIIPTTYLIVATLLSILAAFGNGMTWFKLRNDLTLGRQKPDHSLRNLVIVLLVVLGSIWGFALYSSYNTCFNCGFTSGPIVSVIPISCANSTGVCTLRLNNTGTGSVEAEACNFLNKSGSSSPGVLSPNPVSLSAPGSAVVTCTDPGGHGGGIGNQVTGGVLFSNGAEAEWAGTWENP